ncbi:MAG: hypothetical protein M3P44_00655 [Actinomycetota bacterium]|nr:hypothetical protein [Actinomycetota bacterium]
MNGYAAVSRNAGQTTANVRAAQRAGLPHSCPATVANAQVDSATLAIATIDVPRNPASG